MSHWCRWEYRTLAFGTGMPADEFSTELNRLGAEGWEAYFVGAGVVQLKRQHPNMPAAQRAPSRPMPDLVRGKEKEPAE